MCQKLTWHVGSLALASRRQRVEQCFGRLQNRRIKALGKPAVDWGEVLSRIALTLLVPEPGESDCCPQLPEFCASLLRDIAEDGMAARKKALQRRQVAEPAG